MTTALTTPDWLALRDGGLKPGLRDNTLFVMVGGQPQYRLDARPAEGKHICHVTQTINGRQLGDGTTYPDRDAALAGGLEQLRAKLGW
jgi:hypothetical protein